MYKTVFQQCKARDLALSCLLPWYFSNFGPEIQIKLDSFVTGESEWKLLGMDGINSKKIAVSVSCLLKCRNENFPFVFSGTCVYITLLCRCFKASTALIAFVVDLVGFSFVRGYWLIFSLTLMLFCLPAAELQVAVLLN